MTGSKLLPYRCDCGKLFYNPEQLDKHLTDVYEPEVQMTIRQRALIFIDRRYVSCADKRQKAMGLAYVTAERRELAIAFETFAKEEILLDREKIGRRR